MKISTSPSAVMSILEAEYILSQGYKAEKRIKEQLKADKKAAKSQKRSGSDTD